LETHKVFRFMTDANTEETIGYLISKAHQSMKNLFMDALKQNRLNITVEQWAILNIVKEMPGITQSEIARLTKTDKANIMRMIDLLEKKEYLRRQKNAHDRRQYNLFSTPFGQRLLEKVHPIAKNVNRQCVEGVSKSDMALLRKMLRQIRSNADRAVRPK
jgi:DNA-binding MarR family transcriptional regulator